MSSALESGAKMKFYRFVLFAGVAAITEISGAALARCEDYILPHAKITDSNMCGREIGAGGNLKVGATTLKGKCEGAGVSPRILNDNETRNPKEIEFVVQSSETVSRVAHSRDRTELALTQRNARLYYGKQYHVAFDLSIPGGVDTTNEFFYLAQFWQGPESPPIIGLRMQRGQERRVSVIARGERSARAGHTITSANLAPGKWVNVAMRVLVTEDRSGCVAVSIDHTDEERWCGEIGFLRDRRNRDFYRFKFGIYKGHEVGKRFIVHIRRLSIAEESGIFNSD